MFMEQSKQAINRNYNDQRAKYTWGASILSTRVIYVVGNNWKSFIHMYLYLSLQVPSNALCIMWPLQKGGKP